MTEPGVWEPKPVDTSGVRLGPDLLALVERLAENAHDHWGMRRLAEGWRPGPSRDDALRTHPLLVPYADLPESEKDYDRELAVETIKVVLGLGYRIVGPPSQE
ncbi:RyR domain-containing protein [Streptomyces cadmiisoli]|uniref:Ryanodine receptor Ryr n=1 Tax=Streptomyces cadmiisoli TaxID=2184053 RepID=A0A2Z4IVI3_9ACTN|nr:RyR domain-containing protein [Streptomyces cadmiisoli]AWW36794.1 Ryanodine receptor Ryr [Streptomyces cadmiisoli]